MDCGNKTRNSGMLVPSKKDGKCASDPADSPLKTDILQTLSVFIQTTSVKGVSKASKSNQLFLKIIWIGGTLVGLAFALLVLSTFTMEYLKYSTVMQIEKCTHCKPEFPDITVCNLNILSALADYGAWDYSRYVEFISLVSNNPDFVDQDLTDEQINRLYEMYSVSAYFANVDLTAFWTTFFAVGGQNLFVHDCTW